MQHTNEREADVQKLCEAVLNTSPKCWDNPNGAYETQCPFCYQIEYRGGNENSHWAKMSEITHSQDCAYFIAKDLSTNIK